MFGNLAFLTISYQETGGGVSDQKATPTHYLNVLGIVKGSKLVEGGEGKLGGGGTAKE